MKTKLPAVLAFCVLPFAGGLPAHAQGTAFSYQGQLQNNGSPVNGLYDFRFRLDADPAGSTILATVFTNAIPVSDGLFTTTIDFGAGWFNGTNYWLEVDVRTNSAANYTALSPLQALTPTPYVVFANTASNLSGTLPAGQLSGAILNASLPASPVFSGIVTANSFSGDGTSVSNVNAAALNGLNASSFWQLGGNKVAPGQFLGSTNNQAVEVRVNGQRAIRVEPPLNINAAPNIIEGSIHNSVVAGAGTATIGGGIYNTAGGSATVGGGDGNIATGGESTIGGGYQNQATNTYATVGGGGLNTAGGFGAAVAAGLQNIAGANYTFVGGGYGNVANGNGAVISGGGYDGGNFVGNVASGAASAIGGGLNNQAANSYATVPGGANNLAGGPYSFAAGQRAKAVHQGAFVWADSQAADFSSTMNNQFLIRAQGGVGINTASTPDSFFSINTNAYLFSHTVYLRGEIGSDHNHGLAYNGNTVTNFGTGNYQVDGPALWGFGGGLLGTRNGGDHAALTWNTTGVTISGTLNFPQYDYNGVTPLNVFAGTDLLLRTGTLGSFFFGPGAGNINTVGQQNTAFGTFTLNALTSGYDNVAIGMESLELNTSGDDNTAVGLGALAVNTTGNDNTASGFAALDANATGSQNTAFGSGALEFLGSGNAGGINNIALGYNAGSSYAANESGNIDIGNLGVEGENNVIRIGTPGSQASAYIAGVVTDVGGVQVGTNGTAMSMIQSGQAIMPGSSTVETNFTVTFPHAFSSVPKVIASISGDPGFPTASDTFAMSIRAITSTTSFTVNVVRVDTATGWSQQLRINWQAWQ